MKNFYRNKRILVTGGTGMIGINLVKRLYDFGAKVTVASLEKNSSLPKKIRFRKIDLRNLENCLKITKNIDYVFHLAGIKGSPIAAKKYPYKFMTPMLMFNTNMLFASRQNKVKRFLYTSSIGVYNPAVILKENDVWKTFPSKNDWYAGWAKRVGELNAEASKVDSNMKITIVRPANVFGPYDNFSDETGMVIPSLISKFFKSKDRTVKVWGDGSNIRDFVFADDVSKAMLLVMIKNPSFPINIGSGNGVKIRKIVNIINDYFENSFKILWIKNIHTGDKKRVMSIKNLRKIGFNKKFDLKKDIYETIEWYKKNKSNLKSRFNAFKEKQY